MRQPHYHIERKHRRAARTHKRQRYTDNGYERHTHSNVFKRLEYEYCRYSAAYKSARGIGSAKGYEHQPHDYHRYRYYDERAAKESEFLTDRGEYEVCMRSRKVLVNASAKQALAKESAP